MAKKSPRPALPALRQVWNLKVSKLFAWHDEPHPPAYGLERIKTTGRVLDRVYFPLFSSLRAFRAYLKQTASDQDRTGIRFQYEQEISQLLLQELPNHANLTDLFFTRRSATFHRLELWVKGNPDTSLPAGARQSCYWYYVELYAENMH